MTDEPLPEAPAEMTASIELRTCDTCGQPVLPNSRFCSSCGAPLSPMADTSTLTPPEDTGPLPVIDPALLQGIAAGDAVLVVHRGPDEGARFELHDPRVSVGRAADSTIFLDDVTVSRRHAEFTHGPEGWTLTDIGSLNGSYVNKNRIDQHVLSSGDEVQIGKYRFIYFQVPDA